MRAVAINSGESLRGTAFVLVFTPAVTEGEAMGTDIVMPPVHPGVILREEFLEPMGITEYRLAKDLGIPRARVSAITHGRRGITADIGLCLSRCFTMSEGFWTGLQGDYDRAIAKGELGDTLDRLPVSRGLTHEAAVAALDGAREEFGA